MTRTISRAGGAAVAALASLLVFVLVLVAVPAAGRAQVPQTIGYQGSLTDAAGAPVSGTYDISFTLYDAAVGGSVLWGETQSVAVANGAFSVIFGAAPANPLDPSVFANPTYLGIQVVAGPGLSAPDPEMTPRQALTAVGYALRAKTVETDTLSALSCGPGEVAKWSGSAWGCAADVDTDTTYVAGAGLTLSATTFAVDSLGVANSMIAPGAVSVDKLGFDTATQAELDAAVAAIGPHVTSVNGLSGGTIDSSVSVVGTMSATDLAVSSTGLVANLNADRLDDLQASEIIDAAADEVRTPISTLPFIVSAPGSYYVTGDLTAAANGISVNADNVTIDLMGYSLIGPGGAGFGIIMGGRSNVEIRNGTVRSFSVGINENGGTGRNHRIVGVRAVSNANIGINLQGESHLVRDSTSANNGGSGIFVGVSSTVTGSTAHTNGSTGIATGFGARVTGNTAYNNTGGGIFAAAGSTVAGNAAYNNDGDGIGASNGSTVIGNAAYVNAGRGISVANGTTVSDNAVFVNNGTGIRTGSACTVTNNTALQNNGVLATADGGGIRAFTGTLVKANTVADNTTNGIVAAGVDVAVEENLVTGSTNGVNFLSGGNFYANNRASGNATDYLNGALQTDGGGNFSF